MKPINLKYQVLHSINDLNADGLMYVAAINSKESPRAETLLGKLPEWCKSDITPLARKRNWEPKHGSGIAVDGSDGHRKSLLVLDDSSTKFEVMVALRKFLDTAIFESKTQKLIVDLRSIPSLDQVVVDALVANCAAKLYKFPKYKSEKKDSKSNSKSEEQDTLLLGFLADKKRAKDIDSTAKHSLITTIYGTNLVRWLAKRAGNDLTCKTYVQFAKDLAKDHRWKLKFHDHKSLEKMKAGAFLAVVQGSAHQDYGIVELTYTPRKKPTKSLALVGKGLTFDTGGYSLKPSSYMLGMHGDMAGSAVALSLLQVATKEEWPIEVTAYLAIADNMIGPRAYKPNDVIRTMKGTTIEIIDTDAEGRMVLSDTLHLASEQKPDLMMDFATLTGACVRAIGTTYSGVFTNESKLHSSLIEAGTESGERVWPFPMDKDFAECLESQVADIKQCREKGGVDHIEASQFLMNFVGKDIPWVHVDLSAIENTGGLGFVPTEETGFGVRFASTFIRKHFKF